MADSVCETLVNLRSFVGSALSDIENKYTLIVHDKEALQRKIATLCESSKQLQDENDRLNAKVQELNEKLHQTEVKLSRKDEELQQKDRWWEAYKQMSQKRFRVMKKRGTFPPEVLEEYVNKSIQELITACTEDSKRRINPNKLCRNKHNKRTRYQDISPCNLDQRKSNDKPMEEQIRSDRDTRPHSSGASHNSDVLVHSSASACSIGPPSAASTPLCAAASNTQLTDWTPVTRLPASDSQFPVDLLHTQPHSPTIPSHASTSCDKSRAASCDSSYSLLPSTLKNYTKHGCAFTLDEISRMGKIDQMDEEKCVEQKEHKVSHDQQLNKGKRKRRDSEEKACITEQCEPTSSRSSVFKFPEPKMGDLPKQTNQSKAFVDTVYDESKQTNQSKAFVDAVYDESKMETSAVDMFADNQSGSTGSSSEESKHNAKNDQHLEERKSEVKTPIKECPAECRKRQEVANYKYIEVVRKKEEREQLNGYACRDCQKYFESLDLPEKELKERLKQCSRHRAKFSPPPSTPPDFWNLSFPDTQTYIDKGYLQTEPHPPHPRKKTRKKKALP